MSNVIFYYQYRDGDNYKQSGAVVFANPDDLPESYINTEIERNLDDGVYFIASQIDVPEAFLYTEGDYSDFGLAIASPVESVANCAIPTSTPTAPPV